MCSCFIIIEKCMAPKWVLALVILKRSIKSKGLLISFDNQFTHISPLSLLINHVFRHVNIHRCFYFHKKDKVEVIYIKLFLIIICTINLSFNSDYFIL